MEGAVKTKTRLKLIEWFHHWAFKFATIHSIPGWYSNMGLDVWQILRWPTFRHNQHLKPAATQKSLVMPMLRQNISRIGDKKVGNLPFGVLCSFPTSNRTNHTPKKIRSKEGYHHGFPQNKYQTKLKQTQWFHDTNPPHFTHSEQTGIHEDWHHAELPAGAMNWTLGVQRPFEIAPAFFFLENQLPPSIFRGSQRQQFLDAAYLHSMKPKPFLGGPSVDSPGAPEYSKCTPLPKESIPGQNTILTAHRYPVSQHILSAYP